MDSGSYRIHFQGKHEFLFVAEEFEGLAMRAQHPLLMDYIEEWQSVYFASAIPNAESLISKLSQAVSELTDGWRSLPRYLNSEFNTTALLQSDNGLLLGAPRTIVDRASPILAAHGVSTSIIKGRLPVGSPHVLIAGPSFVVAESFKAELLPPEAALKRTNK